MAKCKRDNVQKMDLPDFWMPYFYLKFLFCTSKKDQNNKSLTKQSTDHNRYTGFEMLALEENSGLGYGEDAKGRDEGGHQLVHIIPFKSKIKKNRYFLNFCFSYIMFILTSSVSWPMFSNEICSTLNTKSDLCPV